MIHSKYFVKSDSGIFLVPTFPFIDHYHSGGVRQSYSANRGWFDTLLDEIRTISELESHELLFTDWIFPLNNLRRIDMNKGGRVLDGSLVLHYSEEAKPGKFKHKTMKYYIKGRHYDIIKDIIGSNYSGDFRFE